MMQTLEQFGQTIKTKYPQYNDIPDAELGQKMLVKYPQYQDMVQTQSPASVDTYGATFPSTGNESLVGGAAKTIGNIPSSAYSFAKGLVGFFNPINTAKTIGQIPSEFTHLVQESGGVGNAVGETAKQILPSAYGALVPKATQQLISGDIVGARATLQNDPVGQILPYLMVGRAVAEKAGYGQQFDNAISKIASPVTNSASYLASKVGKGIGAVSSQILGAETGAGASSIKTAVNGGEQFIKAMRGEITPEETLNQLQDAFNTIKQNRANEYQTKLAEIKGNIANIDISPIHQELLQQLKDFNISPITDENGKLDFSRSTIRFDKSAQSDIQHIYDTMKEYGTTADDRTPIQVDSLKRAFGDLYSNSSNVRSFIQAMKSTTRDVLNKNVPGYEQMTKGYSTASNLLDEIKSATSLGGKANADTIFTKVTTALKSDKEFRLQMLNELENGAGVKLIDALAGHNLSRWIPGGRLMQTLDIATAYGILNHVFSPQFLPLLFTSSPRLVGEFLNGLGVAKQYVAPILQAVNRLPEISQNIDITGIKPKIGLTIEDISKKAEGAIPPTTNGLTDLGKSSITNDLAQTIRGTKGLTADQIMQKYPDIMLKKEIPATDIYGNKIKIPEGEALTPYELRGNKVLLQDGGTYIVSKNQFANIKGNAVSSEVKPFAPELKGTEEVIKGIPEKNPRGKSPYETQAEYENAISSNKPKFSSYQLPGGKNYKEILIKAPFNAEKDIKFSTKETKYGIEFKANGGETDYEIVKNNDGTFEPAHMGNPFGESYATKQEAFNVLKKEYLDDIGRNISRDKQIAFKSPHWDEPNVISHLRLNERTYQGKPVTFMEEMQSDWAREARAGKTTATAPQLKNWQELSVKRALQEAVNNKSDYLAWTTGEQQAARYNLSSQVDSIKWEKGTASEGRTVEIKIPDKGGLKKFTTDEGGIIFKSDIADWEGKKVSDVIGKGIGEKIMAEPKGNLSGEGLNIGGEWAKNLYDKQIKNIVEDVTGGKVQTIDMGLPIEKGDYSFRFIEKNTFGEPIRETVLKPNQLKVGAEILDNNNKNYIITDILGDGKFKAISKEGYEKNLVKYGTEEKALDAGRGSAGEQTFDISTKKSAGQQAIKITPEIRALVKGEAPKIKASGKSPFIGVQK